MLQGQVAIITGASSGIGAATALALARAGVQVAILGRSVARLNIVAAQAEALGVKVLPLPCDITDESQVASAIKKIRETFDGVDMLINSAGLSLNGEVDGYALADWRTVLDTNLTGTFLTCRAVLPFMKKQGAGQIINISSGAGRNGIKQMAAYCAAKFGVIGFTEALALEVRQHNIRVSVLLPGSVATNFSATAKRVDDVDFASRKSGEIGYSMTAEEVASVIVGMLSQPQQVWLSEVVLRPLNLDLHRTINSAPTT